MRTTIQTHSQYPVAYGRATLLTLIKSGLLALALACGVAASAQTVTTTTNFSVGMAVPDDMLSGVASSEIVSTPIAYITGLKVSLKLTGTWNGDLYCFLTHSSGYTVLLNRVGRRSGSSIGYSDEGFNVTFDDAAANGDVHIYRRKLNGSDSAPIPGALTNVWAPDARTNSPSAVLDTDPRTALLSSFNGLNPNGEWVLFVADLEAGDVYTLDNWGLEITGYTPPSIALQPADTSAECSSGAATFSVTADGSAPLAFQWRLNGSPISGATTSAFTTNNPTFASAGQYDVVISNDYGTITSSAASLTIQDTTPPSIACPPTITVTTDPGQCFASGVNLGTPIASDTCGGVTLGNDAPAHFSVGTTTVTWTATDEHNNANACTQTVIVTDNQPPTVGAPANIAANADQGQCTANASFAATPSDNCGVASTIYKIGSTPITSPYAFPVGATTVDVTVTDIHNNSASASFTVTVTDNQAPAVGAPANIAANADPGQCTASVSFAATPSDNCGVASTIYKIGSTPITSPHAFPVGTTTVDVTVTDIHNNSASASFTVTVTDNQAPAVTCPANIVVFTTNTDGTTVTYAPTATDNCGVQSVVASPVSGSTFAVGTNQVSVTATDIHGNTSQCSFTVAVVLDHAPLAGDINLGAVENYPRYLLIEKVLGHCSDVDNNPLTIVGVSANSTNGGTVTLTDTNITYTSATNFVGNDLFTYTISDGRGGLATGSVFVQVSSADAPSFNRIGSLTHTSSGMTVTFAGIPGYTYTLQRSTTLSSPDWTTIGTFVVPDNGIASFTDTNPPSGSAFYRTVSQ